MAQRQLLLGRRKIGRSLIHRPYFVPAAVVLLSQQPSAQNAEAPHQAPLHQWQLQGQGERPQDVEWSCMYTFLSNIQ
jgi:hypothetical protein